jgi:uncharacterized SAM-binding protein YcdF (DUF218 family)
MYSILVWQLLEPFTVLWLLLGLALINLWRKRQETRRRLLLVTVPYFAVTVLCLPVVGDLSLLSLERLHPPLTQRPEETQAIVVLSSHVFSPFPPGQPAEMDESSYDRCLKAAQMYHQGTPCPVVVSGTSPDPDGMNHAAVMRDFLVRLGVSEADVIVEGKSHDTYENAVESAVLLHERGLSHILLVTDATHLHRAAACFRKQGLEVIPCGCRYRKWDFEFSLRKFLPRAKVGETVQRVCHEWLGLCWYWFRDRI